MTGGRHPLPKGSEPLSPETCERRAEVYARLMSHLACDSFPAGMSGTGQHDRFAVWAKAGPAMMGGKSTNELARCSSLARAEVVAQAYIDRGWTVECAFDLDTLDGPEDPIQDGDTVQLKGSDVTMVVVEQHRHANGEWRLYDAPLALGGKWMREPEVEIIARGPQFIETRWPKRYDIAGIRTFIVFNTVATPTRNWA